MPAEPPTMPRLPPCSPSRPRPAVSRSLDPCTGCDSAAPGRRSPGHRFAGGVATASRLEYMSVYSCVSSAHSHPLLPREGFVAHQFTATSFVDQILCFMIHKSHCGTCVSLKRHRTPLRCSVTHEMPTRLLACLGLQQAS